MSIQYFKEEFEMTTIKVPDMMCENCVKRITNALTDRKSVV